MAEISQIQLASGTIYKIKDAEAREAIKGIAGAMHFIGVSSIEITDGLTKNPITVGELSVTAKNGDVAVYGNSEFVFSEADGKWHELGSTSRIKALAYKDSATGNFTPSGAVSKPTFTGNTATISSSFTPQGSVKITTGNGTANYTPAGSVSKATVNVNLSKQNIYSIESVGVLPKMEMNVVNETLVVSWNNGQLPTRSAALSVATGVSNVSVSDQTFTGTAAQLIASFTGTQGTATASYTPSGEVSKPTFTGTKGSVTVK